MAETKWCDHSRNGLDRTIAETCRCDQPECDQPASVWRFNQVAWFHYCPTHIQPMADVDRDAIDTVCDELVVLLDPYLFGAMSENRYEVVTIIVEAYLNASANGGSDG